MMKWVKTNKTECWLFIVCVACVMPVVLCFNSTCHQAVSVLAYDDFFLHKE